MRSHCHKYPRQSIVREIADGRITHIGEGQKLKLGKRKQSRSSARNCRGVAKLRASSKAHFGNCCLTKFVAAHEMLAPKKMRTIIRSWVLLQMRSPRKSGNKNCISKESSSTSSWISALRLQRFQRNQTNYSKMSA